MDKLSNYLVGYREQPRVRPIRMVSGYELDTIADLDGLRELRPEWDAIAPVNNVEPWQSFEWIEAAAEAYSREHLLRIITVRKKGCLTAVAPLVLKPTLQPLNPMQLHFIGGEELKEPNRFIFSDQVSLNILMEKIVSEPAYPIRLSRIPNQDGTARLFVDKFRRAGWIIKVMKMPYPYIDLKGKIIKKSLKSDLRRAARKAKSFGEISFDLISSIEEKKLQKYLDIGFRIEASGWKGANNTAILSNETRKHFFERYAHSSLRSGTLRLCFLKINQEAVAVQYAIASMNGYWLLNVGYDEKFRNCSPGNLLLEASIHAAAQKNLFCYNLLGKEEPWTRRWTESTIDCVVLAAYRPNLRGVKSMLSDALYLIDKRFKENRKTAAKRQLKKKFDLGSHCKTASKSGE